MPAAVEVVVEKGKPLPLVAPVVAVVEVEPVPGSGSALLISAPQKR